VPRLGAHMSIAGGVSQSLLRGHSIHCEAVQIFTKNQLRWVEPVISAEELEAFRHLQTQTGIYPVVSHGSYLTNLGSPDDVLWQRSIESVICELRRCDELNVPYMVMHPGSHVGSGVETGLQRIVQGLDIVHSATRGAQVMILIETTAGQGTNLGCTIEHLAHIVDRVDRTQRIGICLDTCHTFAAGYELRTREGYDNLFAEISAQIGLKRLRVFHLNGSVGALGSRLDRHCHLMEGELGLDAFRMLLNDVRFADRPMILETPKGKEMEEDVVNLAVLRKLVE
jgi:deoxyribonuclease-4